MLRAAEYLQLRRARGRDRGAVLAGDWIRGKTAVGPTALPTSAWQEAAATRRDAGRCIASGRKAKERQEFGVADGSRIGKIGAL